MAGVPRNSNVGFQLEVSEGGTPDRASARLFDLRATMSADAGAIPPAQPSRPSLLSRLGTLLERVRTPPVTRSTVAVLAITFVVATSAEGAATNLALVPGKTVPMAWNLLTASWLETNPAALLLACVAAVVLGRLVEPAVGGGREFIRFLVFVTGFVGLSTFVASLLRFYATRDERSLYEPHHGFQGVLAGLLVAVKQHLGENPVNVRGLRWCKCKTLPHAHLAACALAAIATGRALDTLGFALFGMYGAWLYVRYLQPRPDGSGVGDPDDRVSFASFFPPAAAAAMAPFADAAHACCCGGRERRLANAYGTGSLHPGLGHLGGAGAGRGGEGRGRGHHRGCGGGATETGTRRARARRATRGEAEESGGGGGEGGGGEAVEGW